MAASERSEREKLEAIRAWLVGTNEPLTVLERDLEARLEPTLRLVTSEGGDDA